MPWFCDRIKKHHLFVCDTAEPIAIIRLSSNNEDSVMYASNREPHCLPLRKSAFILCHWLRDRWSACIMLTSLYEQAGLWVKLQAVPKTKNHRFSFFFWRTLAMVIKELHFLHTSLALSRLSNGTRSKHISRISSGRRKISDFTLCCLSPSTQSYMRRSDQQRFLLWGHKP